MSLAVIQAMVAFTTLASGTASSIDTPQNVVVRTTEEWTTLWKRHSPEMPAPAIDFTRTVVVGVFLGSRPTAGFDVEITAVRTADGRAVVEYVERRPDPADIVAQVLTSPFHLVSLPGLPGPVEFRPIGP